MTPTSLVAKIQVMSVVVPMMVALVKQFLFSEKFLEIPVRVFIKYLITLGYLLRTKRLRAYNL